LDDEKIVVRSARCAREAVILQLDARVGFSIVLGDVAWRTKAPLEMGVAYGASKCLWTRPFKTEAMSFMIIAGPVMCVPPSPPR
jgi:hypothetical protein